MPYVLNKWKLSSYYDEVGRVWSVDSATGRVKTECGVSCSRKPKPTLMPDGTQKTYGKCQHILISREYEHKRKLNIEDCPKPVIEKWLEALTSSI